MSAKTVSFDLESLIRPNIRKLKPYRSARDDFKEGVLMDANENSTGSIPEHPLQLNRYPDPHFDKIRSLIAGYRGIKPEQLFIGNGSDEAIDLIIRVFCRAGKDKILITPPTYGMYKVSAEINDVETVEVPLTPSFSLPVNQILETPKVQDVKLIFLCSPNNPTGNLLDPDDIRTILQEFPGIVIVDEAYIDFSPQKGFIPELDQFPNLIVLQTLSKAFGLAGIRLGTAAASTSIIRYMMRVKPPYNVNTLTQDFAIQAFGRMDEVKTTISGILDRRSVLIQELHRLPVVEHVYPTDSNFLLVRIRNAKEIYRKLAENGVIVRYRGDQIHCENCLRITVGNADENRMLLKYLKSLS